MIPHILLLQLSLLVKFGQLQEVGAILGCLLMSSIRARVVLSPADASSSLFYLGCRVSTAIVLR